MRTITMAAAMCLGGFVLCASPALARCNSGFSASDIQAADVIFSGTVRSVETSMGPRKQTVVFDVDSVWKGPVPQRFTIYSFHSGPEALTFVRDRTYVVFAHKGTEAESRVLGVSLSPTFYVSGQCGDGSANRDDLTPEDMRRLGAGAPPRP